MAERGSSAFRETCQLGRSSMTGVARIRLRHTSRRVFYTPTSPGPQHPSPSIIHPARTSSFNAILKNTHEPSFEARIPTMASSSDNRDSPFSNPRSSLSSNPRRTSFQIHPSTSSARNSAALSSVSGSGAEGGNRASVLSTSATDTTKHRLVLITGATGGESPPRFSSTLS